uniref:RRM domain-containing protein n=1 Tax=Panagrellus redivivus TaxID=6233 RepID=A0A7E4VXW7_PANRE
MEEVKAKPRRKRPRTFQARTDLKSALESAILSPKSNIVSHFTRDGYKFRANLHDIIRQLDDERKDKYLALNSFALKSINNRTRVFTINGEVRQPPEQLTIEFLTKLRGKISDTIAYVDNLPLLATKTRLAKRCSKFGTVVNIFMPAARRVCQKHPILRGSIKVAHSGYAFVQFSNAYSVKRFCRRYVGNSHLRRHLRRSRRNRRARFLQRQASMMAVPWRAQDNPPKIASNPPDANITLNSAFSGSCSQVDWSGVESGVQSDNDGHFPKRNRKLTFNLSDVAPAASTAAPQSVKSGVEPKKIRRKRPKNPAPLGLKKMFRNIQVFPLRVYRRLKKEYYNYKRLGTKIQYNQPVQQPPVQHYDYHEDAGQQSEYAQPVDPLSPFTEQVIEQQAIQAEQEQPVNQSPIDFIDPFE